MPFFDHVGPGSFEGTPPPFFLMPKGALLHSYLVHFDPVGATPTMLTGSITFDPTTMSLIVRQTAEVHMMLGGLGH